jgi:hypothetical protein
METKNEIHKDCDEKQEFVYTYYKEKLFAILCLKCKTVDVVDKETFDYVNNIVYPVGGVKNGE